MSDIQLPIDKSEFDIISQERHVIDRLTTIRVGKSKILGTLDMLKKKKEQGENVDNQLMQKLVESYDSLKAQEDDYLGVMKQIIEARSTKTEIEAKKLHDENNANKEDDSSDVDWEDVKKELEELKKLANEAETASAINDQLVNRLQLHRQKKNVMNALKERKTEEQVKEANDALQEVEFAKLQLASEQDNVNRKQRQLDRLRREAVKRGILPDPNPKPKPDPVEPKTNPIKEKLAAKIKDEDLAPADRVPPVPVEVLSGHAAQKPEDVQEGSKKKEKKKSKKELLEETKQNREDVSAKIRERLAALQERTERMRDIQARLKRLDEAKMEDTYATALKRLQNLTDMRIHLEQVRESGQDLTPEQEAELEKLGQPQEEDPEQDPENASEPRETTEQPKNPSIKVKMVQLLDSKVDPDDEKEASATPVGHDSKEHSLSPETVSKAEAAKKQLSSGRAKLEKQRTLERVRCFTTTPAEAKVPIEEIPEANGLEKEICMIMEVVLPWIKEREEGDLNVEMTKSLRDLVLNQSIKVCFPAGDESDLFKSQLTTILDDTLGQYVGSKLATEKEQLMFDLSEILYNELAFFKLMHDIETE